MDDLTLSEQELDRVFSEIDIVLDDEPTPPPGNITEAIMLWIDLELARGYEEEGTAPVVLNS
jgi:hypothetical protein